MLNKNGEFLWGLYYSEVSNTLVLVILSCSSFRILQMGCFIYYSYLNEDKKKVYSRHSHNLYIDYKF